MLNSFTKVDISFDDFRQSAKKRLPKLLFEYIDGAASDGSGEADNRKIIRQLRLNTKALINVEKRSLNHKIFRIPSKLPIAIAISFSISGGLSPNFHLIIFIEML